MKMYLYAIRDCIAGCFDGVFTFRSNADARRAFCAICNDRGSNYGRYPSDYDLYAVGSFDTESARLDMPDSPVFLSHGSEFASGYGSRGAAVGGQCPPEDKPTQSADDDGCSTPTDQVAPKADSVKAE